MIFEKGSLIEQFTDNPDDFLGELEESLTSDHVFLDNEMHELFEFMEYLHEESEEDSSTLIEIFLDATHEKGYASSKAFVRFIVESFGKYGPWIEEILVHVSEQAELPSEYFEWFINLEIDPYAGDGDLYNGSRTPIAGVAANKTTPPEILESLSNSSIWTIKWRIGMNPSTPKSALMRLVRDASENSNVIIAGVALNPSSDCELLKQIIELDNRDLRSLAIKNVNCTDDLKEYALKLGIVDKPFANWGTSLAWLLHK